MGSEALSVGLAKACCLLTVEESFEQSSTKIKELFGEDVSAKTIERVAHQVESVVLNQKDQELNGLLNDKNKRIPACENPPQRLYITADGMTVHEADAWYESKVGTIYWEDEGFDRVTPLFFRQKKLFA